HGSCPLVGTWDRWYYEQDQAAHLWRAEGDYLALMEVINKLRKKKSGMLEFSE
ncbi:hypothetical protein DBR06_SOUSAS12910019, partial [Sousa chinensis]